MPKLTNRDMAALNWAVAQARSWHGSVTGDRDAETAFLANMAQVDAAMDKVRAIRKEDKGEPHAQG